MQASTPIRMRHLFPRLLLLAPLAAGTLAAQQRPPADSARGDSARTRVPGVSVTAPYRPQVSGSAATVEVMLDSLPAAPAAMQLSDLARRLPFLYIRQNSRGENELSVRGSESRQAAVFFEGVPLTLTWDARTDASLIPLSGVQRVEYVRGLSSVLAGPNAIGGVISTNLFDPPGGSTPRAPTRRFDVQGDQFGGTRLSGVVGGEVARGARGTIEVRAGGGWRNVMGFARPGAVSEPGTDDRLRLNSDSRTYDGFAAVRASTGGGAYLSSVLSTSTGDRGVVPELHIRAPRLWRNPELSRQIVSIAAGSGVRRSRFGTGDIEATVGMNRGHVGIAAYGDRTYTRVVDREVGDDQTITARLLADHTLGRFATLRASATHAAVRYDERLGLTPPPAVRYEQALTSLGAELDLRPTDLLTFTAGVVDDRVDTPTAGGRTPQPAVNGTGWRSGVTWYLPDAGLRLHASASERKRFPALRELYSGALNRFAPNPSLRPETFRGAEAGATFTRGRFDAQAVAFTSRTDDAVIRITLPDRRFQRVNRDRFASSGMELLAGATMGPVQLRADATIQRARLTDKTITTNADREPENLPLRYGSLQALTRLPLSGEGFVRARHVGASSCLNPDTNRRDRQAAGTAIDLGLERRWATRGGLFQQLRALVAIDNVGDRALYDQCGLPQPGRTLRIGLTVG